MTRTTPADRARAYYQALDTGDYDTLERLLATDFVHERPDRTLAGRDRFVEFMREERPQTATTHPLEGIYRPTDDRNEVVASGSLLDADGETLVRFVDVFQFVGDDIQRIETYTKP